MLDHDRNELKTLTSTVFDFFASSFREPILWSQNVPLFKKNHKTCSSGFVIRQIILGYHLYCCFKIWEVPTPVNTDQCLLLS